LTGRPAFSGQHVLATLARILVESPPPVEELCPEVPAGLALLVSRMLAKSPALRPQDGARLAAELAAIEESPATGVPSPGSRVGTSPAHGSQALHAILAAEPEGVGTELAGAEEEVQRRRALLQEVAVPLGAQVEVFDDGAVMALLPARGALEAGRAAECALALRAFLPDTAMVLARWDAQLPAMDADNGLDSAVRELAAEGMRLLFSGVVTTRSPGIRLDAPTAELLPPGFGVHQAPSGRYLISGQGLPSSQ
jgi:hypothetical protein